MSRKNVFIPVEKPIHTWIYLARIIASLAVICLHLNTFVSNSWLKWSLIAGTIWAVPVFIMISGALMPKSLKHRLKRLLPLVIIWPLAYYVYSHLNQSIDFWQMLSTVYIYGDIGHLYFFLILLELALVTPLINRYVLQLSNVKLLGLISGLVILGVIWNNRSPYAITFFIPYLSYYLLGNYLNRLTISPNILKASKIGFILSILVLVLASWIFNGYGALYRHSNPIILTMSLTGFILLKESKTLKSFITKIELKSLKSFSDLTLGIYIFHPIVITMAMRTQGHIQDYLLILVAIVVFLVSGILTFILKKIPFVSKLGIL